MGVDKCLNRMITNKIMGNQEQGSPGWNVCVINIVSNKFIDAEWYRFKKI